METVEKKTKRSVQKRAKIAAVKEAAKTGPGVAYLNDVPTSPRKMRLVADLIRGVDAFKALNILKFESKHPAAKMEKLLASAMANWKAKNPDVDLDKAGLFVKEVFVDSICEPSEWLKDNPKTYDFKPKVNLPAGTYKWAVAIVNTDKQNKPAIQLAVNDETTTEGWVKLIDVKVK